LLQGPTAWREDLLLEGWDRKVFRGVHTAGWVYVETVGDIPELYDLGNDPYQVHNQAQNPVYRTKLTEMQARLRAYSMPHQQYIQFLPVIASSTTPIS